MSPWRVPHHPKRCKIMASYETKKKLTNPITSPPKTMFTFVAPQVRVHLAAESLITRKHSSRMCTTHLPTLRASVAIRCQHQWGGGPRVNKFEQVSSHGHQLFLYSEVHCIMANGHIGCNLSPPRGQNDRQTWLKTFQQLRWRVINI